MWKWLELWAVAALTVALVLGFFHALDRIIAGVEQCGAAQTCPNQEVKHDR